MIKLNFKYSLDSEIERVKYTLGKFDWYEEKGYRVLLPAGLDKSSSEKDIDNKVKAEFESSSEYREYENSLLGMWQNLEGDIENVYKDLNLDDRYTIVLTKYGTGGSYHANTKTIEIRFTDRKLDQILGTILHEMVHIRIEPLIQKYNISHWQKERLVDLIGLRYFKDLRKPQEIKEDVSKVDQGFNKNFPDIEKILSDLK